MPTSHSNQQNLGNVLEEDASWQKPFVLPLFFFFGFSLLFCVGNNDFCFRSETRTRCRERKGEEAVLS